VTAHLKRWEGAHAGWVSLKLMSSEIAKISSADGVKASGRQHGGTRKRERVTGTAESQTPRMYGNFTRENRETLLPSAVVNWRNGGRKR
jgi:hypothetical protein